MGRGPNDGGWSGLLLFFLKNNNNSTHDFSLPKTTEKTIILLGNEVGRVNLLEGTAVTYVHLVRSSMPHCYLVMGLCDCNC